MSERLSYEDRLSKEWNDLTLPNEDMAWADMKRRLEDDDDDDKLPPFWLRGCAIWSVVGILLLGLIWWFVRPEKWFLSDQHAQQTTVTTGANNNDTTISSSSGPSTVPNKNVDTVISSKTPITNTSTTTSTLHNTTTQGAIQATSTTKHRVENKRVISNKNNHDASSPTVRPLSRARFKKRNTDMEKTNQPAIKTKDEPVDKTDANSVKNNSAAIEKNDEQKTTLSLPDTIRPASKKTDSVSKDKHLSKTTTTTNNDEQKSKKRFSFAAGVSMQQQLPVAGQKLTPYNASGRKGSLADYIPSAYVRLYRDKKWFLQSEFKYGAPNYVKSLLYNQAIVRDTANTTVTTTSTTLKKTFYHQLPVTFNYFVIPNLSVGAGIVWNKFSGAVSSKDIVQHNNQSAQDVTLLKDAIIVTKTTDTSFAKQDFAQSYLQAVLEGQYQLKHFSFGARYAFGLQPYIRFDLPGNIHKEERNNSLQIFIRYELWRSKKN